MQLTINNNNHKNLIKKWEEDLNSYFLKKTYRCPINT